MDEGASGGEVEMSESAWSKWYTGFRDDIVGSIAALDTMMAIATENRPPTGSDLKNLLSWIQGAHRALLGLLETLDIHDRRLQNIEQQIPKITKALEEMDKKISDLEKLVLVHDNLLEEGQKKARPQ